MSTDLALAQQRLVDTARQIAGEYAWKLDELKANYTDFERPDFVWHYLLQSFATMGRAAGWQGLIGNQANYSLVTYPALDALEVPARLAQAQLACRNGKVRMPDRKANFIVACFEHVHGMGGPAAARLLLIDAPGREAKIAFLRKFPGIGPKYARNIMMDVYHPEFRQSIAIDSRIQAITDLLGLTFSSYDDHERFYLKAAEQADLNGWELDRLMFNALERFKQLLVNSL
jgi:hypothetical protein